MSFIKFVSRTGRCKGCDEIAYGCAALREKDLRDFIRFEVKHMVA